MNKALMLAITPVLLLPAMLLLAENSSEHTSIDGAWLIESFTLAGKTVDGKELDKLRAEPYVIKYGTYVTKSGVTISFDTTKEPGIVTGKHPALDGFHGIFKIDKGRLVICRCSRDDPIPTEFKSTPENGWQLRTYLRKDAAETGNRD
jgi:uncharacterized protein (TIGR03067 family)